MVMDKVSQNFHGNGFSGFFFWSIISIWFWSIMFFVSGFLVLVWFFLAFIVSLKIHRRGTCTTHGFAMFRSGSRQAARRFASRIQAPPAKGLRPLDPKTKTPCAKHTLPRAQGGLKTGFGIDEKARRLWIDNR